MNATLALLEKELEAIKGSILATVPNNEPFNIAHGNWSFAGVTRDDLILYSTSLIEYIQLRKEILAKENESILSDYIRRLTFLRGNTVPQLWGGNSALATSSYISTMVSLKNILEKSLDKDDVENVENRILEANLTLKNIMKPLRAIEARVLEINTRSIDLNEKVNVIEQAHETANQLPTDLVTLNESRLKLENLLKASDIDKTEIEKTLNNVLAIQASIEAKSKEATAIIGRCDTAYRAITSQGLASAFDKRSQTLNISMWIWVVGLVISLYLGFHIGSTQLHSFAALISSTTIINPTKIWIDLILSLLSIGAPVWFAWISTKQIGQRFRLSEDYAYKSSISSAYEGYRREAEFLDPEFQARLFSSALSRLDEVPLRLVEKDTHGSPMHELANSKAVRDAFKLVPEFADKVSNFANNLLPKNKQPAE